MKLVRVIAAGLLVGLSLPAAAHAQGAAAAQRRAQQEAMRPQQPAPPRPQPQREQRPPRDEGQSNRDRADPPAQAPRLVSLNQAVDSVRRSTPGHLLDASPPSGGSRPVYRIRWQADSGQRIDFVVDAQTGAIIGRNGG